MYLWKISPTNTSFQGNLSIRYNDLLDDITALSDIDFTNTNSVYINYNPKLSDCSVNSICDFFNNDGFISIHNNGEGINGIIELEYDCDGSLNIFVDNGNGFTGDTNNYWHNTDNWQNNEIPNENSFVIIPKDYECLIQTDSIANCKILEIQRIKRIWELK